jgi:hypothetical protein
LTLLYGDWILFLDNVPGYKFQFTQKWSSCFCFNRAIDLYWKWTEQNWALSTPDEARESKSWITHHCKLHPIHEKHVCLRSMLAVCFLGSMLNLLYLRSRVRGCLIARLFCKFCKWVFYNIATSYLPSQEAKDLFAHYFLLFPYTHFLPEYIPFQSNILLWRLWVRQHNPKDLIHEPERGKSDLCMWCWIQTCFARNCFPHSNLTN